MPGQTGRRPLFIPQGMDGRKSKFWIFYFLSNSGILGGIICLPFLILVENPNPINGLDQIGLIIWLIGFCGVHLADKQLKIFKSQANRSRSDVCKTGLWKYSRHPNYFFEWVLWTGYIFIGWQAPLGQWLLVIPFILYIFLTRITGVPFVEARKLEASGEEYELYIKETNSFFPGVPKNKN